MTDVMPEPYLGDLGARGHRAVFLGLAPGCPRPRAQSRTGTYADEIRRLGSYGAWAATWPYLRDEDVAEWGRNSYHDLRYEFMKRWFADDDLGHEHMLSWQLFPWHVRKVQGPKMRVPAEVLEELVWGPIESIGAPWVFAFGKPWFEQLEVLGLTEVVALGHGGEPYPTRTKPGARRTAKVYEGLGDSKVLAMSTSAAADPPSLEETIILKEALASKDIAVPG